MQTWPSDAGDFAGRIGFEPEGRVSRAAPRWCAPNLRGRRPEEMLSVAYDLPETRLRRLLHSLA